MQSLSRIYHETSKKVNTLYRKLNIERLLDFTKLRALERIEHIVLSDYYAADSIGNITLLTSDPLDGWHWFKFNEKKMFLEQEIATDLILTQEICNNNRWDTEEIGRRTTDLLFHFDIIWRLDGDYWD